MQPGPLLVLYLFLQSAGLLIRLHVCCVHVHARNTNKKIELGAGEHSGVWKVPLQTPLPRTPQGRAGAHRHRGGCERGTCLCLLPFQPQNTDAASPARLPSPCHPQSHQTHQVPPPVPRPVPAEVTWPVPGWSQQPGFPRWPSPCFPELERIRTLDNLRQRVLVISWPRKRALILQAWSAACTGQRCHQPHPATPAALPVALTLVHPS